ncbi:DUF411 domain-containing protein [Janibacter terrae]|uniref:DUF411 domain-containing protein n=1 Tax=Janibacter terrae TaxID=103817 RepID=UPI0031F81ADE
MSATMSRRSTFGLLGVGSVALLAACAQSSPSATSTPVVEASTPEPTSPTSGSASAPELTVYKDPTCGCCGGWVEHAVAAGFPTTTELTDDLDGLFARHDIPAELQSCHLATTEAGAIFVGHVPARFIRSYLANPAPGSRGLTVPAMPIGSPGMEQGEEFQPYEVLLLREGKARTFAKVTSLEQQA